MRDDVEFLNLGVPAFGTDQAYLRWKRDGSKFKSQIVILGIWPDDVNRNLSITSYHRDLQGGIVSDQAPLSSRQRVVQSKFVNAPVMSDDELVETLTHPEMSNFSFMNIGTTPTKQNLIKFYAGPNSAIH